MAEELHALADQLRFLDDVDPLSSRERQTLERRGLGPMLEKP
jgi:hypothetical protein